jgi:hypothetical protein
MMTGMKTAQAQNIFRGGLRQDKRRFVPPRSRSDQPAAVRPPSAALTLDTDSDRTHTMTVHKRKKEKLTLWVDPIEIDKLRRIASGQGISVSRAGADYLRSGMEADRGEEYRALLEPVIESILNRRIAARDNRLALLLVRNYLVAEQNRGLNTYLVGRVPDMTPDTLNNILDNTFQEAKKKLIRRSPELEELIKEVKSWVIEEERAPWKKNGKGNA